MHYRRDLITQSSQRNERSTRGRIRAGPSLQLGTLSTRIANLLCIILSALSRLSWRAYARRPHILGPGGPLPHAKNEVDRTTRSGDMAKPSADRQTDTRQTRLTNQPAVLPVPSCKLGKILHYLLPPANVSHKQKWFCRMYSQLPLGMANGRDFVPYCISKKF